jgi:hypothetical protein
VVDLLKITRHSKGTTVYLVEFSYLPPFDIDREANSV